jgi:uncharacterized protein YndB with AHSA1/START domain
MIWRVGSVRRMQAANMNEPAGARTRVTKVIRAPRAAVFAAFLEADTLAVWLPPAGMTGHVHLFEPRAGGNIHISLRYRDPEGSPGKSSADSDTFRGRFAELIPHEKIVWVIEFDSRDPAFAGEMTMITTFTDTPDGTEIAMACENIPKGIAPEDNAMGCRSSLQNLAALLEKGQ